MRARLEPELIPAGNRVSGQSSIFGQWFYSLPLRLRSLFRRKQVDQELEDEFREHLEQQIEANVATEDAPPDPEMAKGGSIGRRPVV